MSSKLKLKMTLPQLIIELISLLLLISYIITFFIMFAKANNIINIPSGSYYKSYNVKKSSLLVLIISCTAVYFLITFLQFYPKIWQNQDGNSVDTLMTENLKLMISATKTIFIAVMFYISVSVLSIKIVKNWVLLIAVILTVAEIAYFLTRFFILNRSK